MLLVGCSVERPVHRCDDWVDCGFDAICEPSAGACSIADDDCASGRRFSPFAPTELANACVEIRELAGRGEVCTPGETACAGRRGCIAGRCLSTATLSATSNNFAAKCAGPVIDDAPISFWGATSFPLFPPGRLGAGELLINECFTHPERCPAECETCAADCAADCTTATPADPAQCVACRADCNRGCYGSERAMMVSAGDNHLCFINPYAFCYGANDAQQLGTSSPPSLLHWLNECDGTNRDSCAKLYVAISAGVAHSCAVVLPGYEVECWGDNSFGQTGDASGPAYLPKRYAPFPDEGGEQKSIGILSASGIFTCAATSNRVSCWGQVPGGSAGIVSELSGGSITGLDTGVAHACAIRDGRVWCWGANGSGQSAPTSPDSSVPPTQVLPDERFISVATGRAHTCAITENGVTYCWGDDELQQLGEGVAGPGPVAVVAPQAIGPVAAGDDVTCALYVDDRVRCWGDVFTIGVDRFPEPDICSRGD